MSLEPRTDLDQAVRSISSGGVVGLPTDTVYGLAVGWNQKQAMAKLFRIKQRPPEKQIAILVASSAMADELIQLPAYGLELAKQHWPGALTLIAPLRDGSTSTAGDASPPTLGVRVPAHQLCLDLLTETGPLAVTSANLSGHPPVTDHLEARQLFSDQVDCYLPGEAHGGEASTVLDLTTNPILVRREGPIQVQVQGD